MLHHQVVVIGGGNAGLSVAGRLTRYGVTDIVVIEPRDQHLYQPMFSHVAGGTARAHQAVRSQASVMPKKVGWIHDSVASIQPEINTVHLASGATIGYDHLIVCPGIHKDWDRIPGLAAAIQTPAVCSNYALELAAKASLLLRDLRSGTVVFTQPAGPATCAGAAQKPMYLACDYWKEQGVLGSIRVVLLVPDATIFGISMIDHELSRKIAEYGIELRLETELREVDSENHTVTVGRHNQHGSGERIAYDVLHVVPPQSAPQWLQSSGLSVAADAGGFVDVDPYTLRHKRYSNVWSLGDAAATLNSKSGGALRKQTMTLAKNLRAALAGKEAIHHYDNYSVCPFTVSRSTVVFAEFNDTYEQKPTIPFWKGLARERRLTWVFDRHILPWVYWHLILKGRA